MNTMLSTTLRLLRAARACKDRYAYLQAALGKGYGDNTPIPLRTVLEVNGLDDTLWALRAVPAEQTAYRDTVARLLAADYAARVLPIYERRFPDDSRPRLTIETARRFARGKATPTDLAAARDAARGVVWDAACAVEAAVWAAEVAARDVARDAERRWQEQRLRQYLTATRLPRPVPLLRRPR